MTRLSLSISLIFLAGIVSFDSLAQELKITRKYEMQKLEGGINTRHDDAAPVISPDGKTLYYFISNHPDNKFGEQGSQDIWVSYMDESGNWSPAEHLKSPLNENHGNQVFTVLNNGNTLFIRGTAGRDDTGFSITNRSGNGWSRPRKIEVDGFEEMNKNRFYGATMSTDMQHMIIYFSTNPRVVWSDLYYSKRLSGNKFSKPVKLKGAINSGWDEFGPFLSPDNKSLYFASDRKNSGGLGGADLYVSRRLDDTWLNWSEPENLGPPINTTEFDGYISIDAEGNIYLAMAGKKIDGGNLDILQVVPKDIHIYLEGIVKEYDSGNPLVADVFVTHTGEGGIDTLKSGSAGFKTTLPGEGTYSVISRKEGYVESRESFTLKDVFNDTTVNVELKLRTVVKPMVVTINTYDSKTNELLPETKIVVNDGLDDILSVESPGTYQSEIKREGAYSVQASRSGYLESSGSFSISQDENQAVADVYLEPIEVGTTVVLENIYFDFNKTTLKSESFVELNKVVNFLNDNPTLQIEISGHTDAVGTDKYNEDLSQGRAESVVQYLIENGIGTNRLVAKGYGESKPIATNETDEGRAQNRRVEFTVLAK